MTCFNLGKETNLNKKQECEHKKQKKQAFDTHQNSFSVLSHSFGQTYFYTRRKSHNCKMCAGASEFTSNFSRKSKTTRPSCTTPSYPFIECSICMIMREIAKVDKQKEAEGKAESRGERSGHPMLAIPAYLQRLQKRYVLVLHLSPGRKQYFERGECLGQDRQKYAQVDGDAEGKREAEKVIVGRYRYTRRWQTVDRRQERGLYKRKRYETAI